MKKYLLAVDGSKNAHRAAEYLLDLVKHDYDLDITVIHVVNYKKEIYNFSPFTDVQDIKKVIFEHGNQVLEQQTTIFDNAGVKVNKVVVDGDAGFEIAKYAKKGGFSQIVLGSRGLSDLKGLVLGSVSHKVLHFAQCPVTLVK